MIKLIPENASLDTFKLLIYNFRHLRLTKTNPQYDNNANSG